MRSLIEAELRRGNYVVMITSESSTSSHRLGIHMAKRVTTRARASSADMLFMDAILPIERAAFIDPQLQFMIIEEACAPSVEPDMDAIRASIQALELLSDADRFNLDGGLW